MSASAPKAPLSSSSKAKTRSNKSEYNERQKEADIRTSNLIAAKAIQDLIRTSLGPRGMDKMISSPNGENIITNDGATIMQHLKVRHPAAKMLVEMSKSQDIEAGDGTTSVVVLAGSLLGSCLQLINKGIHATRISESFQKALKKTEEILTQMAIPVDLADRDALIKSASTSLNSKVVSHYSSILAPLAVDAVLRVIDPATATNVELRDIHVVKKVGGTLEDTELVDGLIFPQGLSRDSLTPSKVANAKIALIQFCISPPKTYMDNSIVITDYSEMDRVLKEERDYILNICKKVKASGCNVLLIQKSILRDAASDLALHFLAKLKILVVTDVERTEIEFITKTIGCTPIASIEAFTADKLGTAKLVEEVSTGEGRIVKITGVPNPGRTVSVLCRGSNQQLVDEVERSVHDALCVVRSLVKKRYMIVGGGAPEIECSIHLANYAKTLSGVEGICIRAFAEALEVIPYTLAENAGLNPIAIVTELRNRHVQGEKHAGINVKKGTISDIYKENVVQPLLVSTSSINLATETTTMILKIDDVVLTR